MDAEIIVKSYSDTVYIYTVIVFALALLAEMLAPRRIQSTNTVARWLGNFSIGAITWYVSTFASFGVQFWLAANSQLTGHGLALSSQAGPVPGFFALLLCTQFVNYWVHRGFHQIGFLWPLHAIHHSDTEVDVSTSYRSHPLEPLVSLPIMVPLIMLLRVSPEAVFYFRLFGVTATVFSHSNIYIPPAADRCLRLLILTPDYHRLHHCSEPRYTNSNYGSLLPWFDYLFGTARTRPPQDQAEMELGLEYQREKSDSRLDRLLTMPTRVWRQARG